MPTLRELQKRLKPKNGVRGRLGTEEVLIDDVRGQMTPGEIVEQKLRAALEVERVRPPKFVTTRNLRS